LDNGTFTYGVEAKRPESFKNVIPRFKDGSEQLNSFGVTGAVLVDAADCVRGLKRQDAELALFEAAQHLIDEIHVQSEGRQARYSHIIVTALYARTAWTAEEHTTHAMTAVHLISRATIYAGARNTLEDHRAKWLRERFTFGLRSLTDPLHTAA
jgi:hypothetical protein